ncbi:MAG: pyrimidine/purine nucleoside phosphorylase [Comamonadaceae bacterium]|jgi:uncharacterized protein YaiE (UPF0345 family)|nr:MAG: pyrimidine/purine nucleoside phosphorylase [Comamonadaceae bacterium]
MSTTQLEGVTVATQASVYFDGKCVSHSLTMADGSKKSVGVVLPATLVFGTVAPETMECVAGSCEYQLPGSTEWLTSSAGQKFQVPGNTQFQIRVSSAYHYICHYG